MYTCLLFAFHFIYYIRIINKNHKKLTTAFLLDWSSRTELRSKTRNKQIYQNQPKTLDETIYSRPGRMPGGSLEQQGAQPERCQRKNEIKDDNLEYNQAKAMIKSFHCWKTRRKKTKYIVMI